MTTDIAAEVPYLSQIDACTNSAGSMTYLNNRSDAAWTLRAVTTSTAVVDQLVGLDEWQQVLRSAQSKAAGTEIMAPHSSVLVRARPELVEWSLAAGNTTGWSIAAGMVDFLAEQATKEADELIGSSPRLKAIVTCALAAKDIVGADFERIGTADPVDSLLIALGLAGGLTSCGRDWLAADEAAVTKYARTVEWEELPSMTRRAQFVTSLDEAINTAKRFLGLVIELR